MKTIHILFNSNHSNDEGEMKMTKKKKKTPKLPHANHNQRVVFEDQETLMNDEYKENSNAHE